MKLGILLLLSLAVSFAQATGFTPDEKACFEGMIANKLTSFTASKKETNKFSIAGHVMFSNMFLDLGLTPKQVREYNHTSVYARVTVDSSTGKVQACLRKFGSAMVSCLKTVDAPLTEEAKEKIFSALAQALDAALYSNIGAAVGPYRQTTAFEFPEFTKLKALQNQCLEVNASLSKSLEKLEYKHPQRVEDSEDEEVIH